MPTEIGHDRAAAAAALSQFDAPIAIVRCMKVAVPTGNFRVLRESLTVQGAMPLRGHTGWLGARDRVDVMVEIVAMGCVLLSAGIFAAHAYDMVRNAGWARRV
jgi:hypothetical protein